MPLKTFAKKDEIPEDLREQAIETKDGKFVVVEDDTGGLKSALQKERDSVKAMKAKAKELEEALEQLKEESAAKDHGVTSEKLAEIKRNAEAQAEKKLGKVAEELTTTKAQLRQLQLDSNVKARLGKAKVINPDAAWKIIGEDFDLTDDGKVIVKSDPTADVDAYIGGAVQKAHPYLFEGTRADGGGGGGGGGAGAGAPDANVFKWTEEQRAAYVREHGLAKYQEKLDASTVAAATKK